MSPFRKKLLYGNLWKKFEKFQKILKNFIENLHKNLKNSSKIFLEKKLNKIKNFKKFSNF